MYSTFALDTQVIKNDLCTGCGACQGMCPYWSSENGRTFYYFDCERISGRCQSFCPAMPFDRNDLFEKFFEKSSITEEIGPFKALYLTRSADPKDRDGAQHGGTVTALLKLALSEGLIDAAVLNKNGKDLTPEGYLAVNAKDIEDCRKSSYKQAPTLGTLNKALKENKYKKLAVVGTPCKCAAVYKMKSKPVPDNDNNADNIGLVIGLFCGWALDWDGITELASKYADLKDIAHMDIPPSKYHSLVITLVDGKQISVNLDEVNPLVRNACKACVDFTSEFSDISVGGARSADGWDTDKGWNQLIVRSELGEKLIALAKEKGILEFKELPDGALDKIKKASMGKKNKAIGK